MFRLLSIVLIGASLVAGIGAGQPGPGRMVVRVTDAKTSLPLPCRLTVLDREGRPAGLTPEKHSSLAYRPGVIYTGTGEAAFSAPAGRYTLHATRGLEYGLATRTLDVSARGAEVNLRLEREVDTAGYVSCDPHIHTLTHSGHGDSTIEERMATIAGEGIELAIATDHNHHTDYTAFARSTGTHQHFTSVIGNEVTTREGHFNAFPIRPGSAIPDYRVTDWKILLPGIRAVPGVRVVVLNHPSNDHSGFIPTDPGRFHPHSGESRDGRPWDIDGIEVITSAAMQSDWMKPYRDWFALLNRGRRIAGIGSSDSHDVDRFILGQGRTYVASRAEQPDQIDIQEACDSFLAGKVLASMGLLAEAWALDSSAASKDLRVRVRVQGPRWITADRLDLFANGARVLSRPLSHARSAVVKADVTLTLPRPAYDVWLVAIAAGPGADHPYWPIPRPYQPTDPNWEPRVIGSSSVLRADTDGDGAYSSPADYARKEVDAAGASSERLMASLARYDAAVAVQAASLLHERGRNLSGAPWAPAVERASPAVRQAFVAYRNALRAAP